ncbi:hypothetical protein PHMEG_00024118, partial [Phytophthora megakarya]
YPVQHKREALRLAAVVDAKAAATVLGYPRRTDQDWVQQQEDIFNFRGVAQGEALKGEDTVPIRVVVFSGRAIRISKKCCRPGSERVDSGRR